MKLLERPLQPVDCAGTGLEYDYDLDFVGELVFPAIKGPRARENRSAGDQSPVQQCPNELRRFVGVGECGEDDNGVGVAQFRSG